MDMASKWDDRLRQAAETRGTVTITCTEGEKDDIAAAAEAVGARYRLHPQLDRAPANGMRVGFRHVGGEGEPPLS
ncbi:hypothetical protein D9599_17410 [Roseomonas sp. KE2513]|uniref:hypothetical protein n=1 Tax=Roseomonas sp. KE2513 TaxID=2479202 RepID=UPI0018DF72E9|nr:hypothetical protein [Roseomonas sp. KE2513]MBI0537346.1 hypothetical protein [Roseomonas sp. KE2513]